MKQKITLLLKIAFVLGLLYILVKKGAISVEHTGEALRDWRRILPAFACFLFTAFLGVVRWHWLLRAQGTKLSLSRAFHLTMVGNFFNIALPGAVSGDFVKAYYIGKEVSGQRARAFGSILFDRVAGLSALVLVSAFATILGYPLYHHTQMFHVILPIVTTAGVCVILFYAYLFLVREKHDPVLRILKALEERYAKIGSIVRIYEGLRHYHNHRITVLKVLALSVSVHLIVGWACLNFALALGETNLPLIAFYMLVPLGLLVTAVPIAPAGVGTGNVAFLFLFGLLGSQRGADVFSLTACVNILMGAIGGIFYLRFRSQEPAPVFAPGAAANS
ncbi:MAG: lysylphosphatidylglycerol synthase transmembrane domain-containing protein [Bdellovibrionota bacterium]